MDRDLAIKVIKRMIKTGIACDDGYAYEPLTNDEKGACEMGIKALEKEPCSDCISREDAKNLFWDGTEGYDCRGFTRMEIGEMLDGLPSVNPQEPVLDKIRAEVERLQKMCDKNDLNLMAQYSAFGMVLDILDKYKAESEGE